MTQYIHHILSDRELSVITHSLRVVSEQFNRHIRHTSLATADLREIRKLSDEARELAEKLEKLLHP